MQLSCNWVLKCKSISWNCQPTHSRKHNRTFVFSTSQQILMNCPFPMGFKRHRTSARLLSWGSPPCGSWGLEGQLTATLLCRQNRDLFNGRLRLERLWCVLAARPLDTAQSILGAKEPPPGTQVTSDHLTHSDKGGTRHSAVEVMLALHH